MLIVDGQYNFKMIGSGEMSSKHLAIISIM